MNVSDIMTRPVVTVHRDVPLRQVAQLLAEHDIRGLPVIDGDGRIVGFISESDILEELRTRHDAIETVWLPTPFDLLEVPLRGILETEQLRDVFETASTIDAENVMRRKVVTVQAEASMEDAARLLDRKKIGHLPVVDDEGRPIGIVSRHDIVRALAGGA